MSQDPSSWFQVTNAAEIPSPALLVFPARIEENIRRMIRTVGDAARLRPHMKTHKMPELIAMQRAMGIEKFKCATIAEAEMTAAAGAREVLLAYQPVGPHIARFAQLIKKFPAVRFACLVDDTDAAARLSEGALAAGATFETWLDVDCGQHRTGVAPGTHAVEVYRQICALKGLSAGGLHAYDGHLHDSDATLREKQCDEGFATVLTLRDELLTAGMPVPRIAAGGTPTFPFHAKRPEVECSPGTLVLWDAGYSTKLPDMNYLHAAVLLTRVVSKPQPGRLCLDLGHKAVASEMPQPRVIFPELPDARAVMHSEEHLVLETDAAARFNVGDVLYGIPWHVCPTVALHAEVFAVNDGQANARWSVAARARRLTV
jgi:D-threonine aldolase